MLLLTFPLGNLVLSVRILIVEDDEKIGALICQMMAGAGYVTTHAKTGEEAFFTATTEAVDAIVLDLGLPGRDGMEVLNALRERHNDIPILILSARAERSDRINGLKAGADDYLTKPFFVDELEARVQALLRRGRAQHPQRLVVANMTLDVLLRRVTRGDQLIAMTALEFEIVELLMRNARRVVSRQMLSHSIWKDINRATPLDNVIDVHISRIRKKVDLPGLPKLVHTIRGVGFMLSDDPD